MNLETSNCSVRIAQTKDKIILTYELFILQKSHPQKVQRTNQAGLISKFLFGFRPLLHGLDDSSN